MIRCLDIHTHLAPPRPEAVVSSPAKDFNPLPGQLYSLGIHPWTLPESDPGEEDFRILEEKAALPQVAAIGECGVDLLKGGPLFRQLQVFRRQIEISEKLEKPVVIHSVKADDIILGLKRDLNPSQPWVVHGFRGKPQAALQLLKAGIYLSFGCRFNDETVAVASREFPDRILAETDECELPIHTIIENLEAKAGIPLLETIAINTINFLHLNNDNK